jgi:serine/threonine protein phosphatase PrpC
MGLITTTVIGITDVGLVREHNEDCFVLGYSRTGQRLADKCRVTLPVDNNSLLMVVSDGMGGCRAGEVASRITVDTIMREMPRLPSVLSPHSRLEAAIEAANYAVWVEQQQDTRLQGMGATVIALLIERDAAYISEVGDSRAYILRDGVIRQITNDQTLLQALLDTGAITPEVAARSANRNVLLQAMGQEEYLQVACSSMKIRSGDIFLLCSDGLSGKIPAQEIDYIIHQAASLDAAGRKLVELAKERGGEDNITLILTKIEGDGLGIIRESLSRAIHVHARFDPDAETPQRPIRKVREATYDDWVAMAMVDYFAENEAQRMALKEMGRYGDYIVFRKGDGLVFQGERPPETLYHYWLVSGRYRVEIDSPSGEKQALALIVPPTDMRGNEDIQQMRDVPVKRQFFTASLAMLNETRRNATIWCEDDENIAIRVPASIYFRVGEILGSRFLNAVKHS